MITAPAIFKTINNRGLLYLRFDKSFRNKSWAENFGEVQEIITLGVLDGNKFTGIIIDFTYCDWVDPLPLLSLLLSVKQYKFRNIKNLCYLLLPSIDTKYTQTLKVVKFLVNEGFLLQFKEIVEDRIYYYLNDDPRQTVKIDVAYFEKLDKIDVNLYYSNSLLISAEVIDLSLWERDEVEFEKWVNNKIRVIEAKLLDAVFNENDLNNVIYKLKNFYGETLINVKNHAYHKDESRIYAGVYARLRYGLRNNSLTEEIKTKIHEAAYKVDRGEEYNCPRLSPDYIETTNLFIEAFIIDNGEGFVTTLKDKIDDKIIKDKITDKKWPFRIACNLVFQEGARKSGSSQIGTKTKFGGLYHIGKILVGNNDFLCGRDYNEWVGDYLPFNDNLSYLSTSELKDTKQVKGLSWIIRITPNNYTFQDTISWKNWIGSPKQHPYYSISLTNIFDYEELRAFKILDFRFFIDGKNKIFEDFNSIINQTNDIDNILIFSKKNLTKLGVWKTFEEALKDINKSKKINLIVVDITERDKNSFIAALNLSKFEHNKNYTWPSKINNIILITQNLFSCIIRPKLTEIKDVSKFIEFEKDDSLSEEFLDEKLDNISFKKVLQVIRFYDSYYLWFLVFSKTENRVNEYFINGNVRWNDSTIIDGYLDFSQMLANQTIKQLLSISLERLNGIFESKVVNLNNIDILTKSICEEFNSLNTYKPNIEGNKIYIGSICVTGEKIIDALWGIKDTYNVMDVHFFLHRSSKIIRSHLFLWFSIDWVYIPKRMPATVKDYKRVGKTHVIAKYGYKYYTILRYYENNKSIYYSNPKETYLDFQSIEKKLIKIGNYNYNGYPDLFKIDIKRAISLAFEFKEPLSQFLVSEVFLSVGGRNKNQLLPEFADYYWRAIEEKLLDRDYYENIKLIVYQSQINTNYAIGKIKDCISDEELKKKIIPLTNINYYKKSNSFIISQHTEMLLKDFSSEENSTVLLFDCAVVSGRTRKEIKSILLNAIGFSEVKTLTILDRSRLPISKPNELRHRAYYRLDIPRFNLNDINPINKVLKKASEFEEDLSDIKLKFRIYRWLDIWKEKNVFEDRDDYGLKPTLLNILNNKSIKKFGIEKEPPHDQIGGVNNKIIIKNSIGLNLYITEIRSNTGRDDLILKFFDDPDYQLDPESKIELLVCQLFLFSNENSPALLSRLISELYRSMISIKESNNYSAIACIALLYQPDNYIQNLLNQNVINIKYDLNKNIDTTLFYCLLYLSSPKSYLNIFNNVKHLILNKRPIKLSETYYNFHNEIYDSYGILHKNPLYALTTSNADRSDEKLNDALKNLYKLRFIISSEINTWFIRNDYLCISFSDKEIINESDKKLSSCSLRESLLKNIDDSITEISKLLYDVAWNKHSGNTNIKSLNAEITNSINGVKQNVISKLLLFHSLIFCPIIVGYSRPLREKIESIISSIQPEEWMQDAKNKNKLEFISKIPTFYINDEPEDFALLYKKFKNVWVYFDKNIEDLVRNLIINVVQASQRTYEIDDHSVNMKILLNYSSDFVNITFSNYVDYPIADLEDFIKKRRELISIVNYELDCKFYSRHENQEFKSEITLPIMNVYDKI